MATISTTRSALEAGLDRYLAAYARHFLVGERPLPQYDAQLDGEHVVVTVRAPDGIQPLRRRASAYVRLAGDIWGAAQALGERGLWPSLVATYTAHPDGRANEWSRCYDLDVDLDRIEGLEALAHALLDGGARGEAVLLLRRLYQVDLVEERELYVRTLPRSAPPALAQEVRAPSPVPKYVWRGSTTTPLAMLKHVAPFATTVAPAGLLAVAMRIEDILPHLSLSNQLKFFALAETALPALLKAEDGAVREVALGVAQNLGMKLFHHRAFAEAKGLLDLVIDAHGALPESLRARWECRLYLDALAGTETGAEQDWERAAALDSPSDPSPLGPCWFWSGDVRDRRRVALARVAKALAERAAGQDPCKDRKLTKKQPLSEAEKARLLTRAAALSNTAVESGAARAAQALQQAQSGESVTARGFQADEYAARAKVREASGDREGALADYEAARELRIAAGLGWQIDSFGKEIRRLRGAPAGVPRSFDPEWLVDPARTSEERERAATAWLAQPWRRFPDSPAAASSVPVAYVVLRDVLAHGVELWKVAEQDGVALGDRVAFARRALARLDESFDRRDASWLESVLDDSHEVAFFGEGTNISHKSKEERAPLFVWVAAVASADPLTDDAILRGLKGRPWERLAELFEAKVDGYDELRDVFDAVRSAGVSGDDVAVVLRAYDELRRNDWSGFGKPRGAAAKWEAHGKALAGIDASRAAPALVAWTRARAKNRGKLAAKWLWPLYYVGSPNEGEALVAEVKKGAYGQLESLPKGARAARVECLEWFEARATPSQAERPGARSETPRPKARPSPPKARRREPE